MAKARYHKHQRVYVHPVGTWALVEQVKPQWIKDVERPVKIFYDCGLGRDFTEDELAEEEVTETRHTNWRLMRLKNKWQSPEECAHHPHPGTFPVIVTDEQNWGGWRVPGAEYDRDPHRVEAQARLIAHGPQLLQLAELVVEAARNNPDCPPDIVELAQKAEQFVRPIKASAKAKPDSNDSYEYVRPETDKADQKAPGIETSQEPEGKTIASETELDTESDTNPDDDFDAFGLSDNAA